MNIRIDDAKLIKYGIIILLILGGVLSPSSSSMATAIPNPQKNASRNNSRKRKNEYSSNNDSNVDSTNELQSAVHYKSNFENNFIRNQSTWTNRDSINGVPEGVILPKGRIPSPEPISTAFGTVVFRPGFKDQPQDRTIGLNESITLPGIKPVYHTSINIYKYPTFTWYVTSDNGNHWSIAATSSNTPNPPNLQINPSTKPKTLYYQEECDLPVSGGTLWSNVATIRIEGTPINIQSLSIGSEDSQHIYTDGSTDNQQFHINSTYLPDEATDYPNIKFKVRQYNGNGTEYTGNDYKYVSIDQNGTLSVNNQAENGQFQVYTYVDDEGKETVKSTPLIFTISKNLTGPSHLFIGQDAYFYLQGPILDQMDSLKKELNDANSNLSWYLDNGENGNPVPIKDAHIINNSAVIIDQSTIKIYSKGIKRWPDPGSFFLARRFIDKNGNYYLQNLTSKAPFNIINKYPEIEGTQSITLQRNGEKVIQDNDNDTAEVKDVTKGDTLIHHLTLQNNSKDNPAKLNNMGHLTLTTSSNESLDQISLVTKKSPYKPISLTKVDKVTDENNTYSVSKNSNNQETITINRTLENNYEDAIDIYDKVNHVDESDVSAEYNPVYKINKYQDKDDDFKVNFMKNTATFKPDSKPTVKTLIAKAKELRFKIFNIAFPQLINRYSPQGMGTVLDFKDDREPKDRTGFKLSFSFSNAFYKNKKFEPGLPMSFVYYDKHNELETNHGNSIPIETIKYGDSPNPIQWKIGQGLRLKTTGVSINNGNYHAKISWNFTWSL
ncbi:hypothetical protein [Companilactobacillus sp.]|uniref:hypothetical protein n=1 Tax=Companilactobacillus sp. TaxID=2767905 RepID=UPI00261BFB77|nr:hypothetical protein [Companilactobacillus sp.]